MIDTIKSYENFPLWIPLVSLVLSFGSYILGASILFDFGFIVVVLYLAYCAGVELLVVFRSCKHCYYYGRVCGLAKGKIAPLCTQRGDGRRFTERVVSFSDLIPDFLVTIFPVIGGVVLSVFDFSLLRVGMIIVLLVWSVGGTAVLRGSLACNYCKQREIGCPAQKLFHKKNTDGSP